MNVPVDEIIAEAKAWLGTPYLHQASCPGAGADCLGLIRGVWRGVYGSEPQDVPPYTADWSEPQGAEALWDVAGRHLEPKTGQDTAVGDVLLFRMRDRAVAKHLGIALPDTQFIHAYSGHGVVISPLSEPWARRIVARFTFPKRST